MKTARPWISLIAVMMLFGAFALAGTQEAEKKAETLTGCLNPSNEEGLLALSVYEDGKETKSILVMETEDVAQHAKNHTVKLTGTMAKHGDKDVFKVEAVEHIAATCEAATE